MTPEEESIQRSQFIKGWEMDIFIGVCLGIVILILIYAGVLK